MSTYKKRSEAAKHIYISINSCTDMSKILFFPVSIVKERSIETLLSVRFSLPVFYLSICLCLSVDCLLRINNLSETKKEQLQQKKWTQNKCLRQIHLKSGSHIPKKIYIICFIESPLKMMKNSFYLILKAIFLLKIFKFLSWFLGQLGKTPWLER